MNEDDAVAPTPAASDGDRGDVGSAPTVAATASEASDAHPSIGSQFPEPGARIGEFVVLRPLGSGGMGVVVAAYDPRLDRQVALKLVRGEFLGHAGQARLLREAQVMARLSHPHVVPVYHVGIDGDDIHLVMELVTGSTLRAWLAERRRSWRAIVDVFAAAGSGLAAAHAAGLVHRDFKPENVLVGADGRVRVTDFGVAGVARDDGESESPQPAPDEPALSPDATAPTALAASTLGADSIVGTPAYMAPEQLARTSVDARADQFAFAVALWEALYGELPFAATPRERMLAPGGRVSLRMPRPGVRVPAAIRRAIIRGLAADPADRFPSVDAMLAALAPSRRLAPRIAMVAAGALLVGAAVVTSARRAADDPCPSPVARLDGVWDRALRDRVESAFAASQLPYAAGALTTARTALDAYAAGWVEQRIDTCRATAIRHEQSAQLLDLRMQCLDRP